MGKAPLFFIPNKTRNIIAQIGMGYASGYITKECIKKFKTEYKKLPDVYSQKEVMEIRAILETHIGTRKELRKHKNFVIRKEKYLHNL
jgi:6-phosphofructokinase